jgi:hypothetical protein
MCLSAVQAQEASDDRPIPLLHGDVDLRGSMDEVVVPVIIPPDKAFDRATLNLSYSNALAVLPDRSGLDLALNGRPLATLPLVGAQGAAGASIDLPAGILQSGRNEFRFQVRQAHRLPCSRERFEELWSKLRQDASSLTLHGTGERKPVDPASITAFLAASAFDGEPLAIAARAPADLTTMELGSRVAQAVALVRGDRPLSVDALATEGLDWPRFAGRNLALIGTMEDLSPFLEPEDLASLVEGRPLIRRLPADPDHVAMFFVGSDMAAAKRAVDGFAGMATRPLEPPRLFEIDRAGEFKLSDLGFRTQELPMGVTEPMQLQFRLPPSFYAADGQRMELVLNYAYADSMAATAALVVKVNGISATKIRLDDPRGAIVDGARMNLTLGMFHPGINTIAIYPMLDPVSEAACMKDGPVLSLFEDGRLSMPEFARLTHGGDLRDLVDDGFPYGQEQAQVMVSGRDPATIGAAYTLLGKLSQRHGELLGRLEFVPAGATPRGHLIAVGTPDTLPPSLVAKLGLPWQAGEEPVPVAQSPLADATATPVAASTPDPRDSWRSRLSEEDGRAGGSLLDRLRELLISGASAEGETAGLVRPAAPAASLPGSGGAMLVEVASPWAPERIATVLVADRAGYLLPGIDEIIEEPRWSELGGDRVRWRARDNDVIAERLNPRFPLQVPEPDPVQWRLAALTWLAQNRLIWLGLMVGALMSASLVTSLLLRMRRH